ncbi:hypothetical protein [Variovorax gossypii]
MQYVLRNVVALALAVLSVSAVAETPREASERAARESMAKAQGEKIKNDRIVQERRERAEQRERAERLERAQKKGRTG